MTWQSDDGACRVCRLGVEDEDEDTLIYCDKCNRGTSPTIQLVSPQETPAYRTLASQAWTQRLSRLCVLAGLHLDCVTPAITAIPKGSWLCPDCGGKGALSSKKAKGPTPVKRKKDKEVSTTSTCSL